jgi:hypothetical protein
MLYEIIIKIYEYILIKLFPQHFEYKNIERVNSTGSLIEYSD